MAEITFTAEQREAITTTGRSLIVSAAAGSGKTAVLAERCAYLVCDAPEAHRCDVDQLVVLTFTDAAAAEMRTRIVSALRKRLKDNPQSEHLARQVALIGTASISTIHSFCLWMIRRWFNELDLDPSAALLDGTEAELLKTECLENLFADLYSRSENENAPPLGSLDAPCKPADASLGAAMARFVDEYGQGNDATLRRFVLALHGFVESLPDREAWLARSSACGNEPLQQTVHAQLHGITGEITRQIQWCDAYIQRLARENAPVGFYVDVLGSYRDTLTQWQDDLSAWVDRSHDGDALPQSLKAFEILRENMAGRGFPNARAPRVSRDTPDDEKAAIDEAKGFLKHAKEKLWKKRLHDRYLAFPIENRLADLAKTAPHAQTVARLVQAFSDAYALAKRKTNALDFSDLQRFAYRLLRGGEAGGPVASAAASLHDQFHHVLVDEFQDINPLQEAIIRLVSHETDPDRPDNLFVVGDIKQSIYRFRLAEPTIFSHRLHRFRDNPAQGKAIAFQKNFRSRPEILDAVNGVFRQLMQEGTEIVYDDLAALHPGRVIKDLPAHPIELHLLQSDVAGDEDHEDPEPGVADLNDLTRWTPIEREALLIGKTISRWVASGDRTITGAPLAFRDVVILLRATKHKAERTAGILTACGVPARAEVGSALLATREVRDILATLEAIDNPRQDIPLAAVLRNGVLAPPLSEDDLVSIRCHNRNVPFHQAVLTCRHETTDPQLRERLSAVLDRLDEVRDIARRRPIGALFQTLYECHGYFGYVGGLPNPSQRRHHLLQLRALAARFSRFQRQGLHRFLRFVATLEEGKQAIPTASAGGENDDVVRIMSIHKSKGLEFPVVFVADLGTGFNLKDKTGSMIFEPQTGIGLRVVDNERLIEYPTCAHQRAADEHDRSLRAEELRVLYVAMTRARDKLVLTGSCRNVETELRRFTNAAAQSTIPALDILAAGTRLAWLMPALATSEELTVAVNPKPNDPSRVHLHTHDADEIGTWSVDAAQVRYATRTALSVARFDPLPAEEPVSDPTPEIEAVLDRMNFVYPFAAATTLRSAVGASELKDWLNADREADMRPDRLDHDAFAGNAFAGHAFPSEDDTARDAPGTDAAAQRGIVTHRVLQHLDFGRAKDGAGLDEELARLADRGLVTADDQKCIDRDSLRWFIGTDLAEHLRRAGDAYRREFRYIAMEAAKRVNPDVPDACDDQVLVRGVVDGILPTPDGLDIVDFKTDRIGPQDVNERTEHYRPQMDAYARAMGKLWRRPVCMARLVFLSARIIADIDYRKIAATG
ncbi:MAG: helicase-exonuclease AddAB subunit AddA [Phycisphaerae bacterium]